MVFSMIFLCLMFSSSVYSYDVNETSFDSNNVYTINSYLSNEDMQSMIDNAPDGTTIKFVDKEYNNISLTINKKLQIKSDVESTIIGSTGNGFCFKFTDQSSGSILSGFNIILSNGNGVIIDGADNIVIYDNTIVGGSNSIVVKDSTKAVIYGNQISKASANGIQVQGASNITIVNNTVSECIRSGIELNNVSYGYVADNYISRNNFNGISMYGNTKYNLLTHNTLYRNLNGIYICSASESDVIYANSAFNSFKDPSSELGGFETGNGILIGPDYKTINGKQVNIYNNYLAHNENFQVKNNPLQNVMKIGANYYDSNDDSDTFVCPMLLSRILLMKVDLDSVPNGFALQIMDGNTPVDDMGTFTTKVNIDGVERDVTVVNGKAIIETDSQEHTVEVKVGNSVIKQTIPAKSQTGETIDKDTQSGDVNTDDVSTQGNEGVSSSSNSTLPSKSLSGINQAISSGNNNSNIIRKDTSNNGEESIAKGESSSVAGEEGESKKAYELAEPAKDTSKTASDVSVVIIVGIVILIIIFAVGFKHKNEFD